MSLQVWLPLNGNFNNQGVYGNLNFTSTGTITDADGKIGQSKQFSSSNIIAPYSFTLGSEISFCTWIYYTAFPSSSSNDWILHIGSTSGYENAPFGISTYHATLLSVMIGGKYDANYAHGFSLNTWYHIAFTYGDSIGKLYINGALVNTYNNLSGGTKLTGNKISIASNVANSSTKFKGRLNDVRVYDNCLSVEQIKEIAKGLVLHYPLDNNGWGQENLYTGSKDFSGTWVNNGAWTVSNEIYKGFTVKQKSTVWGGLAQNIPCSNGDIFTISFYAKVQSGGRICSIHRSSLGNVTTGLTILDGNFILGTDWINATDDGTQWKRYWATIQIVSSEITYLQWRIENSIADKTLYICGMKLEKGSMATPWCPAPSDTLYTTLNIGGTTEYDTSGFQNNGTRTGTFTYTNDTPKFNVSSTFNGTNSYIKTISNDWMVQGATEFTVNFWAKATTWPTNGGRLVSCTETGGFNLEAGNSGYWRFPIHVYTAADLSSVAYKYDSKEIQISALIADAWNMITLVYNSTGTKTYINGQFHHTYTNTSYGIHFNTNARLFLGCEANTASPSTPYFLGQMSDFRFYYTALNADDIAELYAQHR